MERNFNGMYNARKGKYNGRELQWKEIMPRKGIPIQGTLMEGNSNGRELQLKGTSMQENSNGREIQWKGIIMTRTSIEGNTNERELQQKEL